METAIKGDLDLIEENWIVPGQLDPLTAIDRLGSPAMIPLGRYISDFPVDDVLGFGSLEMIRSRHRSDSCKVIRILVGHLANRLIITKEALLQFPDVSFS